jgi:hypothetical protein
MLINPEIVLTFTRQRWSCTNHLRLITSLGGVNIKSTQFTSSTYFLLSQHYFYFYLPVLPLFTWSEYFFEGIAFL